MKIISKEKAWFGYHIKSYKGYCFEEINNKYIYSVYNELKFLSEITVNDDNEFHSFNDQPALIYKDYFNRLCKAWFINGEKKRSNPEKPCFTIKGFAYYFNDGKLIGIEDIKENFK